MPIATPPKLEDHEIDALLYDARIGESSDLIENINLFAKNLSTTPAIILAAAVDPDSGNGVLHMASANGHTGIHLPSSPLFQSACMITAMQTH